MRQLSHSILVLLCIIVLYSLSACAKKAPVITKKIEPGTERAGTVLYATANLRLRKTASTTGETVITLKKGTGVKIIRTGPAETINNIWNQWILVEVLPHGYDKERHPVENGVTGWCFGGYLSENDPPNNPIAKNNDSATSTELYMPNLTMRDFFEETHYLLYDGVELIKDNQEKTVLPIGTALQIQSVGDYKTEDKLLDGVDAHLYHVTCTLPSGETDSGKLYGRYLSCNESLCDIDNDGKDEILAWTWAFKGADMPSHLEDELWYEMGSMQKITENLELCLIDPAEGTSIPVTLTETDVKKGMFTLKYPKELHRPIPVILHTEYYGGMGGGTSIYTWYTLQGGTCRIIAHDEIVSAEAIIGSLDYTYRDNALVITIYQEDFEGKVERNVTLTYTQDKSSPFYFHRKEVNNDEIPKGSSEPDENME